MSRVQVPSPAPHVLWRSSPTRAGLRAFVARRDPPGRRLPARRPSAGTCKERTLDGGAGGGMDRQRCRRGGARRVTGATPTCGRRGSRRPGRREVRDGPRRVEQPQVGVGPERGLDRGVVRERLRRARVYAGHAEPGAEGRAQRGEVHGAPRPGVGPVRGCRRTMGRSASTGLPVERGASHAGSPTPRRRSPRSVRWPRAPRGRSTCADRPCNVNASQVNDIVLHWTGVLTSEPLHVFSPCARRETGLSSRLFKGRRSRTPS